MIARRYAGFALTAALMLLGTVVNARGAKAVESEAQNRQIVQTAFDKWRDGSGGAFDLLEADAKWTIVGRSAASKTYESRGDFITQVIQPFNARLSRRLIPAVRAIYADGDMVIVLFDAKGIALDGKPYENTYTWYLQMRGGKIVKATAFFDSVEFNDLWTRVQPKPDSAVSKPVSTD